MPLLVVNEMDSRHYPRLVERQGGGPPRSLLLLAEAVERRLDAAGIPFSIRYSAPSDIASWRFAVDVEDGTVDFIFGSHESEQVAVVLDYQEDVSVELATEFVAMNLDLITEDDWRSMFDREVRAEAEADLLARAEKRRQRRDAWRKWLVPRG